jgi:hypothetical protein
MGGWLLSALSIVMGGEWCKPSTDVNLNHKHKTAAPKFQAHFKSPVARINEAKIMYIPWVMYSYHHVISNKNNVYIPCFMYSFNVISNKNPKRVALATKYLKYEIF